MKTLASQRSISTDRDYAPLHPHDAQAGVAGHVFSPTAPGTMDPEVEASFCAVTDLRLCKRAFEFADDIYTLLILLLVVA